MDKLELSEFQKRALCLPESYDLFLGGGRGSAKSWTLAWLALRHVEVYGAQARILYLRRTYAALSDFELTLREVFGKLIDGARYNQSSHVWRFPNSAVLELGQLENWSDYSKYQGRSFTLLLIDEVGEYPDPRLIDLVRSNLRSAVRVPLRVVLAANPGGPGHAWLVKRYINTKAEPWTPFTERDTNRTTIYAPSTYKDNPFIDQAAYESQLRAAASHDPELLKAWLSGDFNIVRGAFFEGVLDEERNMLKAWPYDFDKNGFKLSLAYDHGSSAPAVCYLTAESEGTHGPDGRYYPKASIILLDELATNVPGQINEGLRWNVPQIAESIIALCKKYRTRPRGVADDAIFSFGGSKAGSIAHEFRINGVFFTRSHKGGRLHGWERMRIMLSNAGKSDLPGLYITRNCEYFWNTLPSLPRDPKNPDDLDSRAPDHAADAARYRITANQQRATFGRTIGNY